MAAERRQCGRNLVEHKRRCASLEESDDASRRAVAVLCTLGDMASEGGGVPERRLARQHLQRSVHDAASRRMQRQPQLATTQQCRVVRLLGRVAFRG